MLGKKKKKLDRRMRRRIRKTSAVVLLISAIVVAAIPVPEAAAADPATATEPADHANSITTQDGQASATGLIPELSVDDTIYCTSDNKFQFAYKNIPDRNWQGILVGYIASSLPDGHLVVPEELEAYVPYTTSEGTNRGQAAANQDGKPLYYKRIEQATLTRNGIWNESEGQYSYEPWGQPVYSEPVTETSDNKSKFLYQAHEQKNGPTSVQTVTFYTYKFYPCVELKKEEWNVFNVNYYLYKIDGKPGTVEDTKNMPSDWWEYCKLPDKTELEKIGINDLRTTASIPKTIIDSEILENDEKDKEGNFFRAATDAEKWLGNVKVGCISSQRAGIIDGVYKIDDTRADANFFTNGANIKSIQLPNSLFAIADKSFRRCTNLVSVSFGEGSMLTVLGASAFEGCTSLQSFSMASNSNVDTIGQNAFKDCTSLKSFYFPTNVSRIGDGAFNNCSNMESLSYNISDSGEILSNLTDIGDNVFENCSSLKDVVLPKTLKDTGLALFKGCSSLEYVTLPDNALFNKLYFSDFEGCTKLKWIDALHDNNAFDTTVGYAFDVNDFKAQTGEQFYFIGSGSAQCKVHEDVTKKFAIAFMYRDTEIFEVIRHDDKSNGNLTYQANKEGELLSITIDTDKKFDAVIPSSVGPYDIKAIGNDFSGNKYVETLLVPNTVHSIADGAFSGCTGLTKVTFAEPNHIGYIGKDAFKTQAGGDNKLTVLTFEGDIDVNSVPFQYAMNKDNNYNNDRQDLSYIDFCSGNPTNIHVRYNPEPGVERSEVHQVPTTDSPEYRGAIKAALALAEGKEENEISDDAIKNVIEAYNAGTVPTQPVVRQAVESAYYITLPTGIQGIEKGLFSKANERNTVEDDGTGVDENAKETNLDTIKANRDIRSIVMCDIESLDDYTFYGCDKLESVVMYSSGVEGGESIGDYAFGQCENLKSVTIPTTTSEMGIRPFADNKGVTSLYFTGESTSGGTPGTSTSGENFSIERGIIYEWKDGQKDAVVQCVLERGGSVDSLMVGPDELQGVNRIYPEAFMDCAEIITVDLSSSNVETIPEFCFANASSLTNLYLPLATRALEDYALKDTNLRVLRVPNDNVRFDSNRIFYDGTAEDHVLHNVEVISPDSSSAEKLAAANKKYNWKVSDQKLLPHYTITFVDDDGRTTIASRVAEEGEPVNPPTEGELAPFLAKHDGMYFNRWIPNSFSPAAKDMYVQAEYVDTPPQTWRVRFVNDDLKLIVEREVRDGQVAEEPKTPTSYRGSQYQFDKWISVPEDDAVDEIPMNKITGNVTFMASYDYTGSGTTSGNDPNDPNNPNNPNNPNDPNNPNGSNNGNNTTSGNNANGTLYTLTVVNGSGSGSYAAGTQVTVAAYTPNTGYAFNNWTSSESDTDFTSKTLAATSFKMPAKNLTVTANYITKSETGSNITSRLTPGTVTSAPASNTGSVNRVDSSSGSNGNGGSSVQVNRPGISNGDVASATVNGSTDNFVVKVTEDGQATAAVAEALRNEYGSLDNIRYFAMDISLYDETGTRKVTDTSGLSVTMTLPIPDELRQYAGNNKVGAVTGGNNLDKLNARFTTVNGVPCVTFTATHFSPYTVYVDTANLSAGGYDATPKTGDAIHPKWFLAIGLALFSAVLFLKKDKKVSYNAA